MMRFIVICLLIAGGFLFLLSFGLGAGYGLTGGEVQLFPRWAEAHSEDGTALAVYENQGQISTKNTPMPQYNEPPPLHPLTAVTFGVIIAAVVVSFWLFVRQIRVNDYDDESDHDWEHYSSKEAAEWKRVYGPE